MATPARALDTPVSMLRYSRSMPWKYDLQNRKNKEMLYRALNLGTTVAFLGAGCSYDFISVNWMDFGQEAVIEAWECLRKTSNASEEHIRHYNEKLLEFARRLGIQNSDISKFPSMWDGRRRDLVNCLIQAVKEANNDATQLHAAPSGEQLRFILGACKKVCEWCDSKAGSRRNHSFHEFLKRLFHKHLDKSIWDMSSGIHHALLALPFHRFITSNYDLTLEWFLARKLGGRPWDEKELRKFLQEKAFTQARPDSEKLARFAAGMSEDSRGMVFHCHGWCEEPDSMIVTEADYQKWYLGDAGGVGPTFRQTMELLVGSHPIVFVGFGMKDPDLLMALRTLSATEPERKARRSLFALLPENEAKNGDAVEQLFDQYGVHVVGYKDPDVAEEERQSIRNFKSYALAHSLEKLNEGWKTARESWLLKPKIRRVVLTPEQKSSNQHWHYKLEDLPQREAALRQIRFRDSTKEQWGFLSLEDLKKEVLASQAGKLVVLVGPGGSGKSFCAAQLVNHLLPEKKCFFWSSYYADDALTGIIRASEFFEKAEEKSKLSRLQVFRSCLEDPQNVLVFDGMERFLHPAKNQPDMGSAANTGVSDFLDALKKQGINNEKPRKATVVLTTRFVPVQLKTEEWSAEFYEVEPMGVEEATALDGFRNSQGEESTPTALVTLLGGHRYAMDLAGSWAPDHLDELIPLLANVSPLRHLDRMIELTLCRLDQYSRGGPSESRTTANKLIGDYHRCDGRRPYQLLIKRLAVFMGPIEKETTFEYCCGLAQKEWKSIREEDENLKGIGGELNSDEMWRELIDKKLLFNIERQRPEKACVMHAVVREFVFHNFHHADAHRLATFSQTGFTSGTNMVDPGKKGAEIIKDLFLELRRQCRQLYQPWETKKTKMLDLEIGHARSLCQECFGVLRSRMLANTVSRWGSYAEYSGHLVRMGDLTRAYCGTLQKVLLKNPEGTSPQLFWNHCDPALCADPKHQVIHKHGPLFDDELAWLYHELGLALYHEGAMIDCLAIWGQGLEINKFVDGNHPGPYTFQAYCNLGAACIQYGRLRRAREYLQMAKEISLRAGNKDEDHVPRLNGYLALIRHLRGDLLLADEEYEKVIKSLKESGNARAECIFLRHWADLKLKLKQGDLAANYIRSSRAKAEEGHFPDLVAHARLSEGHLLRTLGQYQGAIREYKIALKAARECGTRGLEADVHSEMARLALDLGDTETARARAIKSLQIANELHLGLRQTHGLVVLGKASAEGGQRELGVEYLKQARELAERQHYELRAREAEEELHRLGAIGSVSAPLL